MNKQTGEHGGVQHSMDKVQDTVGGIAGRISAAMVSKADPFVENAAIGDLYEIEAARLALQRATSPDVKAIAKSMIDDHTTSAHQLEAALEMNETKGVRAAPVELDTRRKKMLEHLSRAPKDKFELLYLDQQVLAHEETLTLMTGYRDKGDNPQLRSYAAGTAPAVERHLHHMKAMRASRRPAS